MVKLETILRIISKSLEKEEIYKCLKFTEYTFQDSYGKSVTLKIAEIKQKPSFRDRLLEAYATGDKENIWRVDAYEQDGTPLSPSHWENCRMFVTENGSVGAIESDGNIISVCKYDTGERNSEMECFMQHLVKNGGTKLDSFEGNWKFYRKCGFEPVSHIGFNKKYAPYGWKDTKLKLEESVVFFKHTGNPKKFKSNSEMYADMMKFYSSVEETGGNDAYIDAYKIRDNSI